MFFLLFVEVFGQLDNPGGDFVPGEIRKYQVCDRNLFSLTIIIFVDSLGS